MIGLGRMGANMVRRLMKQKHECVLYDRSPQKVKVLACEGAIPASSLEDLAQKLSAAKTIWLMLPPGEPTESTIGQLSPGSGPNII
jgi:6-phosphogluconate dehydrogenase